MVKFGTYIADSWHGEPPHWCPAASSGPASGVTNTCADRECCLLVLDSVTSTPMWIRQPKPRDVVHDVCVCDVCVFVCKCVLGSPRAFQPLNIRLCLF
jgi:hypothetical protein